MVSVGLEEPMPRKLKPMSRAEARIYDQFTDDLNAGKNPDIDAILKAHPKLAKSMRRTLEAAKFVHEEFQWLKKNYPKSVIDDMFAKLNK